MKLFYAYFFRTRHHQTSLHISKIDLYISPVPLWQYIASIYFFLSNNMYKWEIQSCTYFYYLLVFVILFHMLL